MKKINADAIMNDPSLFRDGSRRSVAELESVRVGRGEYAPGWRWSKHARPHADAPSLRHIGWIEKGRLMVRTAQGDEHELGPGDVFEVGPGHDAWVIGDEPCIAFDFSLTGRIGRA